jgi:DNA transposition AAA+ family ATPase
VAGLGHDELEAGVLLTAAPRQIDADLKQLTSRVNICIDQHVRPNPKSPQTREPDYVEMLVIDEADRLSQLALEHLRDRFDRRRLGLLLIGMPGIDKRLARYPQLYSRIGFAHNYRALDNEELTFLLTRHWKRLGLTLDLTDFTDAPAVAGVGRITRGNSRLIHRLFAQIERVMRINDLSVITSDVIETARSTLVIGDT